MITLTPAFGRDYKSRKAAQADFDAGKDFIYNDVTSRWNGRPVNKSQLVESILGGVISIRYNKLRKTATLRIKQ